MAAVAYLPTRSTGVERIYHCGQTEHPHPERVAVLEHINLTNLAVHQYSEGMG